MAGSFDHSAGLQFTPGLDHARASLQDDNNYEESQEVYVSRGQTYLQDVESNVDIPVSTTDRDRQSGRSKRSCLPIWLTNSPTCVKVTTAGAALLVVIFVAVMATGFATLPSNDDSKFDSNANIGTDGGTTDGGSNTGSINPVPVPTREPTNGITSSPVAASKVPATPPPSTSAVVVPITTPRPTPEPTPVPTPLPTPLPVTTLDPTKQPTPFPDLVCPKDLNDVVTIDPRTSFYYAIVPTDTGDDGILCGRLEVMNHKGWVGVAVSSNGMMVGSNAIIGEPSTKTVLKYELNGKGANLVNVMDPSMQTLEGASIIEDKGTSIMTFTKRLVEPGEIPITPVGRNIFLHARGDDTTIGYHSTRGAFVLDFTTTSSPTLRPTDEAATPQPTVVPELADSFLQCTEYSTCPVCMGSCDSDFDCSGGLQCFRRSFFEPVPGCLGQGKFGQNYCYNPFVTGATVLLTISEQECDKKAPCGKCFGGCSSDEDCDKNLFCYRRFDNPYRLIPGCGGQGESGTHYCFDPNDIPRDDRN